MYTMGCDPELIPFRGDIPWPVTGLLGGTKEDPMPVGRFGAVQEDNVNAEVNPTPAKTPRAAVNNLVACIKEVNTRLHVHGLHVRSIPAAEFTIPLPESCLMAGCNPDYNVYTRSENVPPDLTGTNLRSAGGHVVMEVPRDTNVETFIKTCDRTLGLMSLEWDKDTIRRQLYGRAGCFRGKRLENSLLLEYRTLSNAWTASEELMMRVFTTFKKVPKLMSKYQKWSAVVPDDAVVEAINTSNFNLAEEIISAQV